MCLLFLCGCEKKGSSIVDSAGPPPLLILGSVSPSSINTDSINVGSSRKPDDTLSLAVVIVARANALEGNPLKSVHFSIQTPDHQEKLAEGLLLDDGVGVDRIKGDGVFSTTATFQIQRIQIGIFQIGVAAEAMNGFASTAFLVPLTVFRGNSPPILSDLQAPDTIQSSLAGQTLTLHVRGTDPDGQGDIVRVIFNSFLPNGDPSTGNPFQMFDDGSPSHGDSISGDQVYSYTVQLPAISPGTYHFKFQAFDRSNAGSNVLDHFIIVTQ